MTTTDLTARHSVRRWLAPLLLLPALTAACSSESLSDTAAEKLAEASAGGDADVDIDSDSGDITVETEDGTFSASSSTELPDDWPSEIPLPSEYTLTSSSAITSDDGTSFMIGGTVPDGQAAFEEVTAEFVQEGWTEVMKTTGDAGAGISSSSTYSNASYDIVFSAFSLDDGTETFGYTIVPATD